MSTRLASLAVAGLAAGVLATAAPAGALPTPPSGASHPDAGAAGLDKANTAIDDHRPYDAGTGRKVG